jgi:hypothetical protein
MTRRMEANPQYACGWAVNRLDGMMWGMVRKVKNWKA